MTQLMDDKTGAQLDDHEVRTYLEFAGERAYISKDEMVRVVASPHPVPEGSGGARGGGGGGRKSFCFVHAFMECSVSDVLVFSWGRVSARQFKFMCSCRASFLGTVPCGLRSIGCRGRVLAGRIDEMFNRTIG